MYIQFYSIFLEENISLDSILFNFSRGKKVPVTDAIIWKKKTVKFNSIVFFFIQISA